MAHLHAVYYRAADGSEPVNEFIDKLTVKRQVVIDNQINRLNMLTSSKPHLPFPHSSQVEGELRELRCHYGSELYPSPLPAVGQPHRSAAHVQEGRPQGPERRDRNREGPVERLQGSHGCGTASPAPCGRP